MSASLGPATAPRLSRGGPGACRMAHAHLALRTQVEQDALRTAWRARDADGAAVPDQQVRPLDPGGARHDRHEIALHAYRIGLEREAEAARQPAHVRVDGDALAPPIGVAADNGCGLPADARQLHELIRAARNLAVVALEHGQRSPAQRARLLVVEAGLEDRLGDLAFA